MSTGERRDWAEGEERAWGILEPLSTSDVCRRAKAEFDSPGRYYVLPVFNGNVFVSMQERRFWGDSIVSELVLNDLSQYARLPILYYLIRAKDIPLSGDLINPRQISGGHIFVQGSHMLPLEKLAGKYGNIPDQFLAGGMALGGECLKYGDAAFRVFPFPRMPVSLLFWKGDAEFPSRAEALFDSTCSAHLGTDVIWSVAMLTIQVMLMMATPSR